MEAEAEIENIDYILDERSFEKRCQRQNVALYAMKFNTNLPATLHSVSCKARHCEQCGWFWAWKWKKCLTEKDIQDDLAGRIKIRRTITLTTSYDVSPKQLNRALKAFWRSLREYTGEKKGAKKRRIALNRTYKKLHLPLEPGPKPKYAHIKYFGVLEENQAHTQPHLHFVLSQDCYIPQRLIKHFWLEAQKKAHFYKLAWVVEIALIKSNLVAYLLKYLLKQSGGKDEIPRADGSKQRYVRYTVPRHRKDGGYQSGFFDVSPTAIIASYNFERMVRRDDYGRIAMLSKPDQTLEEFIDEAKIHEKELHDLVNRKWSYVEDIAKGEVITEVLLNVEQVALMPHKRKSEFISTLPPAMPTDEKAKFEAMVERHKQNLYALAKNSLDNL